MHPLDKLHHCPCYCSAHSKSPTTDQLHCKSERNSTKSGNKNDQQTDRQLPTTMRETVLLPMTTGKNHQLCPLQNSIRVRHVPLPPTVMRQPYRDLPHNLLRDNGRLLGSSITTLASTHTILREIKMFSTLPPE